MCKLLTVLSQKSLFKQSFFEYTYKWYDSDRNADLLCYLPSNLLTSNMYYLPISIPHKWLYLSVPHVK